MMVNPSPEVWRAAIVPLVGKPFVWGGRGPDAYDCWGAVLALYVALGYSEPIEAAVTDVSDVIATIRTIKQEMDSARWERVEVPEPLDMVALSPNKIVSHVGVVTPFGILSSTKQLGVTVDDAPRLKILYQRLEYYRWVA
jgi:hypothetical protein